MPDSKDLTFYNKTERPWFNRLDRSSIVGHTTEKSTKLWFRMKSKGTYLVAIADSALNGKISAKPVYSNNHWHVGDTNEIQLLLLVPLKLDGKTDFSSVVDTLNIKKMVDPTDLKKSIKADDYYQNFNFTEDTEYHYAIYSLKEERWELGAVNEHSFRTMPKDDIGPWNITFGFYSCHMPFDPQSDSKADASMWGLMEKELKFADARFVIGGGDQVYSDGTDYLSIWSWLSKVKNEDPSLEDMLSWYRDIYRGYWGFPKVQAIHRQFPNYMIWDDHEIMDGWGSYTDVELSDQLDTIFEWEDEALNLKLSSRMFDAAKQTYLEYQHSHNPDTPNGQYDYSFSNCGSDYYFLDMRGQRDFEREEHAILGEEQQDRFATWSEELSSDKDTPIFIVSTVPLVHLKDFVSNLLDWVSIFGARDDVRDHWAHQSHTEEFKELLETIFSCSDRTKRPVVVMCGDVHIGGIFELFDLNKSYPDARVFQITSSAITYAALGPLKMNLLSKAVAIKGVIGEYETEDGIENSGFGFKNHLVFPQYNFALVNYKTDGKKTTHINVELNGKSDDNRVRESQRLNLLAMV